MVASTAGYAYSDKDRAWIGAMADKFRGQLVLMDVYDNKDLLLLPFFSFLCVFVKLSKLRQNLLMVSNCETRAEWLFLLLIYLVPPKNEKYFGIHDQKH